MAEIKEFRKDLKRKVASQVFDRNDDSLQRCYDINIETSNKHAARKKRYIRDNQMSFFTKYYVKQISF